MTKTILKSNKLKSSGTIEFLVVFVMLFTFFVFILDVSLFFRQIYLVQAVADETLHKLVSEKHCSNIDKTSPILSKTFRNFYGHDPRFNLQQNGLSYSYSNDKYRFNIICRNADTVDSVSYSYYYKGILFYSKGKYITSSFVSNNLYY